MAESPLDALITLSVVDGVLVAKPLTLTTLRERMEAYTLAPAVPDMFAQFLIAAAPLTLLGRRIMVSSRQRCSRPR